MDIGENLRDKLHKLLIDYKRVNTVKNILEYKFHNQADIVIVNNHKVTVEIYPRLTKYFKCNVYIPFIYNNVYIEVESKRLINYE